MNTDDPRFDRLVDGELSEEDRRELLAGLDGQPGGWRRCALAFLESQCWKQTLGDLGKGEAEERSPHTECADVGPAHGVCGLQSRRSPWPGRMGTLLAMAASFFVAFWVGSQVQRANIDRPVEPAGTTSELASTEQVPAGSNQPDRELAGVVQPTPAASNPWRMVTVSAPAGSASAGSAFRLPAVERDNVDQEWLRTLPPAVPENVMKAFSRTGHRIQQHRELVPVPLQDGRQLVVPVDRVDVHYVGNGTY